MDKDINKIDFVTTISEGCSDGKHNWTLREGEKPVCSACKGGIEIDWYKFLGIERADNVPQVIDTQVVNTENSTEEIDEEYINSSEILRRILS